MLFDERFYTIENNLMFQACQGRANGFFQMRFRIKHDKSLLKKFG